MYICTLCACGERDVYASVCEHMCVASFIFPFILPCANLLYNGVCNVCVRDCAHVASYLFSSILNCSNLLYNGIMYACVAFLFLSFSI